MIRLTVMVEAYVEARNPQDPMTDVLGMDRVEAILAEFRHLPNDPPPRPIRHKPKRRWWLIATVPLIIVLSVAAFGGRTSTPAAVEAVNWQQEVHRIDGIRMRAFMDRDATMLEQVLVAGSPAAQHDAVVMARLVDQQLRLDRNPVTVLRVRVLGRSTAAGVERVRLEVVDRLAEHAFLTDSGTSVQRDRRDNRTWILQLRRQTGEQWRLYSVTAESTRPSTPTSDPRM